MSAATQKALEYCSTCRHVRGRHVPDARPGACVECNVQCPAFMDLPPVALSASPGLDVERTRRVLCEMEHEARHPGNGVAESCIECLRAADGLIADLSEHGSAP